MVDLRLKTSLEAFENLHSLIEGKDKIVKVNVDDLKSILTDHSALCRALIERTAVKLIEPKHREKL